MADQMNSIEKAIDRLLSKKSRLSDSPASIMHGHEHPAPAHSVHGVHNKSDTLLRFNMKALRELGYVTPVDAAKEMSEQFRLIKRPLIVNAFGKGAAPVEFGNLIMFTSSLPNEGKTFMALNTALSMVTEKNTTVLLVDADVVNPSLSRLLGVENNMGLTDLLQDNTCDPAEVFLRTDIPGLRFLPAGHLTEHSTELLASDRMREFTHELSTRYPDRVIIFDSSPLLITSQAAVLSHYMGQVVLVVEACKTPQSVVKESVNILESSELVSLVLNKTRNSTIGGYVYGGYYGTPSST